MARQAFGLKIHRRKPEVRNKKSVPRPSIAISSFLLPLFRHLFAALQLASLPGKRAKKPKAFSPTHMLTSMLQNFDTETKEPEEAKKTRYMLRYIAAVYNS